MRKPTEHATEHATMTGDELAAALYAEQGYLVASRPKPHMIGDVGPAYAHGLGKMQTVIRIIAQSDYEEFNRQRRLATKILGHPAPGDDAIPDDGMYFYRIEAVD